MREWRLQMPHSTAPASHYIWGPHTCYHHTTVSPTSCLYSVRLQARDFDHKHLRNTTEDNPKTTRLIYVTPGVPLCWPLERMMVKDTWFLFHLSSFQARLFRCGSCALLMRLYFKAQSDIKPVYLLSLYSDNNNHWKHSSLFSIIPRTHATQSEGC